MQLTKLLTNFFASIPPDIVLISFILALLYLLFRGGKHLLTVTKFTKKLKSTREILHDSPHPDFEVLTEALPEISDLMHEYQELLLDDMTNTENSDGLLSDENVLNTLSVNADSLEHYPGTFTALGIAGTFVGILFALAPIATEIGNENLVEDLLQGAGTAFVTSIMGIFFSVFFLVLTRISMGFFTHELFLFRLTLNRKLNLYTGTGALNDILTVLDKNLDQITDSLLGMADDISEKIGKAVTDSTTSALEGIQRELGKVVQSAGNSSQEIVDQVLDRMQSTFSKIESSASAQADILDYFDHSIKNAAKFAEKLEKLLPQLNRASENFAQSSEKLAGLPTLLAEVAQKQEIISKTTSESVQSLVNGWKGERERLTELQSTLAEQFSNFETAVGEGIETSMSKFDDELARAGTYLATWLEDLNKNVATFSEKLDQFSTVIHDGSYEIQESLGGFKDGVQTGVESMENSLNHSINALSMFLESIKNSLEGFPDKVSAISSNLESVLLQTTEDLPEGITQAIESMVKSVQRSLSDLESTFTESTSRIPDAIEAQLEEFSEQVKKKSRSGFSFFGQR